MKRVVIELENSQENFDDVWETVEGRKKEREGEKRERESEGERKRKREGEREKERRGRNRRYGKMRGKSKT